VQLDTIIPGAGNPQAFDRYAYTLNNPLRYTDPSGHGVDCGIGDSRECWNTVQRENYIASTVVINISEKISETTALKGISLGTAIGDHSLLTHNHYENAGARLWDYDDRNFNGTSNKHRGIAAEYIEGKESMVVAVQDPLGIPAAQLANQDTMNSLGEGDILTLVFWDDQASQLTTGDFTITGIQNGIASVNDPNNLINSGDSGSGAFFRGELVGNTWGERGRNAYVALNPGFVTNRDWKWMEEDKWWINDAE